MGGGNSKVQSCEEKTEQVQSCEKKTEQVQSVEISSEKAGVSITT